MGGLASIGGGVLFIFVFAWVIVLAGPGPAGLAGPTTQFPEIKTVRMVETAYISASWCCGFLSILPFTED